jgi:hypothetical protein
VRPYLEKKPKKTKKRAGGVAQGIGPEKSYYFLCPILQMGMLRKRLTHSVSSSN